MITTANSFRHSILMMSTVAAVSGIFPAANAHDPGLSSARVTIGDQRTHAVVTFSQVEIEGLLKRDPAALAGPDLLSLAKRILILGGQTPENRDALIDENDNVTFHLEWPNPTGKTITLRAPVIAELNHGHRQYFIARDEARELIVQQFLTAGIDTITLINPGPSNANDSQNPLSSVIENRPWFLFFFAILFVSFFYLVRKNRESTFNNGKLDARNQPQSAIGF